MLAAAARQDIAEVGRLGQTCPKRNYRQNDLGFAEKVRGSRRVAMLWALIWERAHNNLLICVALRQRQLEKSDPLDTSKTPPDGEMPPILAAAAQMLGVYLGLRWFCEDAHIDAEHLVGAWYGWLVESVEEVLDADLLTLLPQESDPPDTYGALALTVAATTEQMLDTEWGGGE